jgi:hypothetical protein
LELRARQFSSTYAVIEPRSLSENHFTPSAN